MLCDSRSLVINNTIAVFGSSRRDGNTGKLLDWIAGELNSKIFDLSTLNISPFDYEHANKADDFLAVIDEIIRYENIIIASPVYWYTVSAQMKVFIDRLSDLLDVDECKELGRKMKGKSVYAVCTSVNEKVAPSFEETIRNTFEYLGMKYVGCIHANCENGYSPSSYKDDVAIFLDRIKSSGIT